ncbi:hypothetical protein [Bacillus thuringiensis]|uniref:hypothetical protein n=1 Tax=Bacillus thuringiensis TaxID=1428 RepID=UPI000BFD2092|nr:hypothetical protein [Bacillus thuringiensis]PGT90046.1 hypothetical protein COD17_09865 [Bacillus thuringiensis]
MNRQDINRTKINHTWGMQIEGLQHILQDEEVRKLLNEGREQGFQEYAGESERNVKAINQLFSTLTTFLTGKDTGVFEVWDGWLVPLTETTAFKLLQYIDGVKGLVVYKKGFAYRLFKHDEKNWYTVSVTESNYIRGYDSVVRKMAQIGG